MNFTENPANTAKYKLLLTDMLENCRVDSVPFIAAEKLSAKVEFHPDGVIGGSSLNYLTHEFEWYKSMDLCIKNHPGIEENPIWQGCATADGNVNSNYGWCVYHADNYYQFLNAYSALSKDKYSRRAELIYTRPSIHKEQCDDKHARQDMMCTNYTIFMIRDDTLHMHVHMRSNDVWYGLRYDLAWQQHVYDDMYTLLKENKYYNLEKGKIVWNADSLHLYERNLEDVKCYIGLSFDNWK